jgi:hypothetical protein
MPKDKIGDKIRELSEKTQQNIRKALSEVLKNKTDPNASFLDSCKVTVTLEVLA